MPDMPGRRPYAARSCRSVSLERGPDDCLDNCGEGFYILRRGFGAPT
jgi:hypothetical protein